MVTLDLILTAQLMRACNAAYELDAGARTGLLTAAALVEDAYVTGANDARALICHTPNGALKILACQGTQFTAGEIPSIAENFKAWPTDLGGGVAVDSGYWEQVQSILPALPSLHDITHVVGHSMGGCIASLAADTPYILGPVVLVTYGAPKCGNDVFWQTARVQPIRIVHARDFAPVYPYIPDEWEQPGLQWWFHDGTYELNLHRPVMPDSIPDHMPDAYIAAIDACVAHQAAA